MVQETLYKFLSFFLSSSFFFLNYFFKFLSCFSCKCVSIEDENQQMGLCFLESLKYSLIMRKSFVFCGFIGNYEQFSDFV